jgi:superfamily I DNA and/or RNA helicase
VEADAIVGVVLALDDHEPFAAWLSQQPDGEKSVGIICTYAEQRELIRRRLNAAGVSGRLLAACKIDTVDSYQGKQNPIVILLVRNNAARTACRS